MTSDLGVIGNISWDTVSYREGPTNSFWGGAALNISLSASYSGKKPMLISVVGTDASALVSEIENQIDITRVKISDGKTCHFEIRYSKNGIIEDVICDFGVANLLDLHFHKLHIPLAHYHICCRKPLSPAQAIQRVFEKSFPFSLDFVLSSAQQQMMQVSMWIKHAKYVFVNFQEFEILRDIVDICDIKMMIVTSAGEPVRVLRSGHEVLCLSCPSKEFLDVTGAGDVFIGAFLASQLKGEDLHKSVDWAIRTAQQSLNCLGTLLFKQ